jgi:hypothetical protein
VPTIASREAGVNKIVRSVVRVDAGDAEELASRILAVIRSRRLQGWLSRLGQAEIAKMSWMRPAFECLAIYHEVA